MLIQSIRDELRGAKHQNMAYYVNLKLLELPRDQQLPPHWTNPSSAPRYHSWRDTMHDLDVDSDDPLGSSYVPSAENTKDLDNRVNMTFSKKLIDIWLCHHGELTDGNCVGLLEKRHQGAPERPAFKTKIAHLKTRQSDTISKALKEVGVAIIL